MNAISYPRDTYPRNMAGYGRSPPHAHWPKQAKLAVQFVLNFEEGGENCVLHGDAASETFLSEIVGAQAFEARHLSMESMYEYGSRAGVWRILGEFEKRGLPLTVFGVAMALQRCPDVTQACMDLGHEIASHGWRWIHHQHMPEDVEREHIATATRIIREMTLGQWPLGWYTGRDSPNTKRLVADHGGYEYDSDYYGDDLPFWMPVQKTDGQVVQRLIVPYSLDTNDMRFSAPQGFNTGEHFFAYLRDAFDVLYVEGDSAPKMMNIGLHCRLIGHPGRFKGLQMFLDHIQEHDRVWVCRRIDIARHWQAHFPAPAASLSVAPS